MHVIKIGGHELDQPGFVRQLSKAILSLKTPAVLIHGGGRALDDLQRRLGIEIVKIDGLRRTDGATLEAALMAFAGSVNTRLVAGLRQWNLDAIGLSGVDGGLIQCTKLEHPEGDLGFVGQVAEVRTGLLRTLLDSGLTPVLAPLGLGEDGGIYNVNADHIASAVAASLGAEFLDFVSNVPGVIVDGVVLGELGPGGARRLIDSGTVNGGMVPKLRAALGALEAGVDRVRIVGLNGFERGGTTLSKEAPAEGARVEVGA